MKSITNRVFFFNKTMFPIPEEAAKAIIAFARAGAITGEDRR